MAQDRMEISSRGINIRGLLQYYLKLIFLDRDLAKSCSSIKFMSAVHFRTIFEKLRNKSSEWCHNFAIASQITSLTIVYSTVYSDADQRKHQGFVSLAFVRGIHRWPVNSPHKWPVTRKMFPLDGVIIVMAKWDFTRAYFNSSPPGAAYMRQWTGSALVQIMACRLVGAKPLPGPMLEYCQLDPCEQTSVNFESKYKTFHSCKSIWQYRLRNGDYFVQRKVS